MITPSFNLTATERVLPKMALDFTTASLDSRVTFTRSGNTATVVNSSGLVAAINANLPRFDYDPVALTCKGLLIEESRTNLYIYSQDFNDANWIKSAATIGNDVVVSPDGTQNADKLVESATTATHYMYRTMTPVSATAYTFSVYAKAAERTTFRLNAGGGFAITGTFNLTAVTATLNAGTSATITPAGNGWYRCTVSGTSSSTTAGQCQTILSTGTYAGDGTSGMYFWGAQMETGAFATSYIPTVASQVTRSADVATMTGTNFSDWYNASEGTFVTQGVFLGTGSGGATRVWQADAGGEGDRLTVITTSTSFRCIATASSVSQADFSVSYGGASIQNSGFAYKVNNIQLSANATLGAGDTSCTIPTVSILRIGASFSGVYGASLIRKFSFFPMRLLNAELQAFTN